MVGLDVLEKRKTRPLVPIPNQIAPVHGVLSYIFNIHFKVWRLFSHRRLGLLIALFPSDFTTEILYALNQYTLIRQPAGPQSYSKG